MKKLLLLLIPWILWACSIDANYYDCLIKKITTGEYKVNGAFYQYDFNKDGRIQKSDWIYIALSTQEIYQLLGNPPTSSNAFGWKRLHTLPNDIDLQNVSGLFIYLNFSMDQNSAFSWLYLGFFGNNAYLFKLMGASPNGDFIYLDLDCDGVPDPLPDIAIKDFIAPSQNQNQISLPGVTNNQNGGSDFYISFTYTGSTPLQCSMTTNSTGGSSSTTAFPKIPYRWSNFPQPQGCPSRLQRSLFDDEGRDEFEEKVYIVFKDPKEYWCKYYEDREGAPIKDEVVYEWMSQDLIAKNGYHKIWYRSGELFLVEKYQMGYLEGKSYTLYKSGNIAHQVPCKNNKADGRELYYDPKGNIVNCFIVQDDYAKGLCTYKAPHQNAYVLYQNRAKIHWSRWPDPQYCPKTFNSSALPEPNGNNGVFDFTANAKDGTVYYFIHLSGDNYVGCRYYESGDIAEESDFIYDNTVEVLNWNGISKSWLADGRLFFVNTYVNNTLQGYTDIYSENGLLFGNLIYINGKAEGKFNIYDQIGNIMFCEMYKHDEVVAPCN